MGRCFTVATESKEAANMEDTFYFLNGNCTSINTIEKLMARWGWEGVVQIRSADHLILQFPLTRTENAYTST